MKDLPNKEKDQMDEVKELREYIDKIESSILKEKDPHYLQRLIKENAALHIVCRQVHSLQKPKKLAYKMVHILREIFGYTYGSFLLIDESSRTLIPLAFFDLENTSSADTKIGINTIDHIKIGKGITGIVAQTGKSIRIDNVTKDQRYISKRIGTLSELCVPIYIDKKVIGVINLESIELDAFTEDDQLLMETISSQIGVAIKNAQLYEELSKELKKESQAKRSLEQSEEKYRDLFDNISDFIYTHDLEGRFITVNRAAAESLGYATDELIGRSISEFMLPDYRKAFHDEYLKEIKNRGSHKGVSTYLSKNNKQFFIEYISTLINKKGEEPFVYGSGRDITEKIMTQRQMKNLQEQLFQAQKMEAIGTLAGGVAHDFNNILMAIQGNASLMLMGIDSDNPYYKRLRTIEQSVESGADLTRQLLGFAREGKYEPRPVDINRFIDKTSSLFGRTKKEIKIYKKFQKDTWSVKVDHGQLEQVLFNIYVNAWQAMSCDSSNKMEGSKEGQKLYLETENVTLTRDDAKTYGLTPGNYVKISISDNGIGMDKATIGKIFEPFFTTRQMGRGTGLGLASAYGIIKNHGGIIDVTSSKGKGSTFAIFLPVAEMHQKDDSPTKDKNTIQKGNETILLVDDEDIVIDIGKDMLSALGYQVLTAGSGKEAIQIYRANKDDIAMVILDMIMPDMGGRETYKELRGINNDVKVLLSSGYSIDGQAKEIMENGCNGFIQKPFRISNISNKVRQVLEGL
ncbi:MAG: PAS domain S-box protein [Deltaproteobacteria bacterium]|nr:PAS domain S-box protein [Deltaproteobacteria bacterium]